MKKPKDSPRSALATLPSRPELRRPATQWVLAACLSLLPWPELGALTPPGITRSEVGDGSLTLTWKGDSAWYEVQSASDLTKADWRRVFRTSESSAGLLLNRRSRFLRVVGLATAPDLVVEDQKRMQIMDEIGSKIASLSGENGPADSQALYDFMSRYDELEGIGISEETSVYARFRDGRPLIIINNRGPLNLDELNGSINLETPAHSTQPSVTPLISFGNSSARSISLQAANSPLPSGIPDSRRAVLFQATFEDIVSPMLKYLNPAFEKRGYQVAGGEATVQSLLNLESFGRDVGVFYIDSHGGVSVGFDKHVHGATPEGAKGILRELPVFIVATSTEANEANESFFKPFFDQGELIYGYIGPSATKGLVRGGKPKPYYCITPAFVKKHWKFGMNSFVYIDTCHGGSREAGSFREACLNAGASLYAGWTDRVHFKWAFEKTTRLLFDTLLGGSQIFHLQPPQRAFELTAVKKYMDGEGFFRDQTPGFPGALLSFFPGPSGNGEFGLLAPSIRQMSTAGESGKIYLDGLFDPTTPALVSIEGNGLAEFEAVPESRTALVIPWAGNQEPSVGQVTVIQRGHSSNKVPLSGWQLKAHMIRPFSNARREPFATMDFNLHLRADRHKARLAPFDEPLLLATSAIAEPGSTCRIVSVEGMYDDGRQTIEWMLPGPVDLQRVWYFDPLGTLGFKARVTFLSDGAVKFEATATAKNSMTVIVTPREGDESRFPGDPAGITTHADTVGQIDQALTIQSGDDSSSPVAQAFGPRFSWERASAVFVPDRTAPGYGE